MFENSWSFWKVRKVKLGCFRPEMQSERVADRFYESSISEICRSHGQAEINSRNSYVLFRFHSWKLVVSLAQFLAFRAMFDFGFARRIDFEPCLTRQYLRNVRFSFLVFNCIWTSLEIVKSSFEISKEIEKPECSILRNFE